MLSFCSAGWLCCIDVIILIHENTVQYEWLDSNFQVEDGYETVKMLLRNISRARGRPTLGYFVPRVRLTTPEHFANFDI